ncbi:Serine phosphatase RsbU, regulator of sigma subunit [Pedococcus cremeus]|uniref:Serine phosphatase RsbU, regulator of sigma subunit n=1 Tax=Pedococcus cremeus TaxID=587636 RepID=A0A1H9WR88_9MICO|nr:PP2C family protein-serine/threonine phosphatase [Pedococcus cremeus]SES36321.1 Serine phosphatase RsbU, regulator of sigma subunit [Pedococcus cremeus]
MQDPNPARALSRVLDAAENASPLDAVEAVTRELAAALGAEASFFLIEDLSGQGLIRLSHATGGDAEGVFTARTGEEDATVRFDAAEQAVVLPFDGGPAELAVRSQTLQVVAPADDHADEADDQADDETRASARYWTVLTPVTERGEVLGLLELVLPCEPDADTLDEIRRVGHILSFVIIANRRHTDLFEWGQRTTRFSLPAEIQRRLLPTAFTCEAGAFSLSAWLEPAASVGGDSFDYSLARDTLHLSITDAMGHGVASALNATLCVGSLRNTRRAGDSLLEQATTTNRMMCQHATDTGAEGFATGLVGRLDLRTSTLSMVNAGHIAPYLCRAGTVTPVQLPADLPFGLFPDAEYHSTDLVLEPGDRLMLVTDGMLERNAAALDLPAEIGTTIGLHPREATRDLTRKVVAIAGAALSDDATVMVLDWYGGHGRERRTAMGSSR